MTDLADVEVFRSLLEPQGVLGLVLDCPECGEQHYFNWELLRGNLRQMIENGQPQVHEPAYQPNPTDYVSWEYARGYVDGVIDTENTLADRHRRPAPTAGRPWRRGSRRAP